MIDLLVAGGGPVGLGVAIRARSAGLEVVVVEPREDPVDKACGEGLMPSAVERLHRLGVHPVGRPFRGIRYVDGARSAEASFRRGTGMGVRRTVLHRELAARAAAVGVGRVTGRVTDPEVLGDRVRAAGLTARWLAVADGLHSPGRRALGLDRPARGPVRFGQRRHYRLAPWSPYVEVHWAPDAEAYVTPVADDLVGVAVLSGRGLAHEAAMGRFPELAQRLRGAEPVTAVRGAGPLRVVSARRVHGRALLVGDAAGYVDALTGEGVATGLACADALVAAVTGGRPQDYEQDWRAATRRYRVLTAGLLAAAGRPVLRRRLVPTAQRLPRVFGAAVSVLA